MAIPRYQHSNGTYGPGTISGLRPQPMTLLPPDKLPEGRVMYPFIVSFDNTAPTDSLVLPDGSVLDGCAAILDIANIKSTQNLSALRSVSFALDGGNPTPPGSGIFNYYGDWWITTDVGQTLRFGVQSYFALYDPGGTPAEIVLVQRCGVSGAANIMSQSPSHITIFKGADSNGTVSGNGTFNFANYEVQPWFALTQLGSIS